MHQLVLDCVREVIVEAVSKVGAGVAGATGKLVKPGGILGDCEGTLPELPEALLGINSLINGLKAGLELLPELVPVVVERGVSASQLLHGWSSPKSRIVLHVRENGADPLLAPRIHRIPRSIEMVERRALGHGPHRESR